MGTSKVSFMSLFSYVAVPVNNTRACVSHDCDDAGCDGLATFTSTIAYGTLRGGTKTRYKAEYSSRHSCFLLFIPRAYSQIDYGEPFSATFQLSNLVG